ncbi:MAG: Uma2 family endonuclease [Thermomicrobiales bacterium]
MALPRQFTVADLFALPENEPGERQELIDGVICLTPTPSWGHQTVNQNLNRAIDSHVYSRRLGWVRENFAVMVNEWNYAIPDLLYVSRERRAVIRAEHLIGAPDLACEIFSPSTRRRDVLTKRALYAQIGVAEYWQIDPVAQAVTVLALEDGEYAEVAQPTPGMVTSRVLPELRLTLAELFADMDADVAPDSGEEA